jgi:hypothetical protein
MSVKPPNMSLFVAIKTTIFLVRGVVVLAALVRDSKNLDDELKDAAKFLLTNLILTENILGNLVKFAQRISTQDENFLYRNIDLLKSTIDDGNLALEEVQRDRNFIQRILMEKKQYRDKLRETSNHLNNICATIQGALPTITRIEISRRELPDFRTILQNKPNKEISFYDFVAIRNTFNSVISINFDDFNPETYLCYFNMIDQQIFFSYHLRIWSTLHIKPVVLGQQQSECEEQIRQNTTDSFPEIDVASSTSSDTHKTIDFMEFCKSHDPICGMALTKSMIYIAIKREIKVFSFNTQQAIAQHGVDDNGFYLFNRISYIYIPPDDETKLYIVDCDENIVYQYKIDDSGLCFEFVHHYIVIANVNQQCKLISCVVFNRHLYVSDGANNCLHIFPLNCDRQSIYLIDNSMIPISPGLLCTHGGNLYVADRSKENPGILVFNERCEPIDWFRNRLLTEILAIDIDPTTNQLCLLTSMTTKNADKRVKKRPAIISMDLTIRTEQ